MCVHVCVYMYVYVYAYVYVYVYATNFKYTTMDRELSEPLAFSRRRNAFSCRLTAYVYDYIS